MPAHRLDMRLIREVLRLKYGAGLSHRAIAAEVGVSVGTVSNYLETVWYLDLPIATARVRSSAIRRRGFFVSKASRYRSRF